MKEAKKGNAACAREPSPDLLFTLMRLLLDLINNSQRARDRKKDESGKEERTKEEYLGFQKRGREREGGKKSG